MSATAHERESGSSWIVSLAFWGALATAAGAYAAVALSPKLLVHAELASRHRENQLRLVRMERRARYLDRVVEALREDPEFAAELARLDFAAAGADDERLPVEAELMLDGRLSAPGESVASEPSLPAYAEAIRPLAERPRLRAGLLAGAAALVLFAFTFLHERDASRLQNAAARTGGLASALGRRYRQADGRE